MALSTTTSREGTILYAPPNITNPLDACELPDLLVSLKTNSFHTPFDVSLAPQKRPSKSSNTFFCPVCPSTPIAITKSPFTIKCPSCKWDASDHGVNTVSDLLLADSRPYHELFKRIRVLGEQLSSRDPLKPGGWELDDAEEPNEIPVERRFDAGVKRREQEPARRRMNTRAVITVNGNNVGLVENGKWKVRHAAKDVLPDVRVSQSGDDLSLVVRNVHAGNMHVRVGEQECVIAEGTEREFLTAVEKVAGWGIVDMVVERDEGVYCGTWKIRLFVK